MRNRLAIVVDAHLIEALLMDNEAIGKACETLKIRGRPGDFRKSARAREQLKHHIAERGNVFAPQIDLAAENVGLESSGEARRNWIKRINVGEGAKCGAAANTVGA